MKDQKWFEDMEQRIPHGEVRTHITGDHCTKDNSHY